MIETLQQWNTRLGYCGCCPMPVCPTPVVVCSVKDGHEDNAVHYPFAPPMGDPTDLFPTLYQTRTETLNSTIYNGVRKVLERRDNGATSWESYLETNFVDFNLPGNPSTAISRTHDYNSVGPTCVTTSTPQTVALLGLGTGVAVACPVNTCTETVLTYWTGCFEFRTGVDLTEQGCPGPFADHPQTVYVHVDSEAKRIYTLSNPVTPVGLDTEATAAMNAETWSGATEGGSCKAIRSLDWPLIEDYTYPACGAARLVSPFWVRASAKRVRFRFRIPVSHTGSVFDITYDVAEFPTVGDPSFVSQDNVVEWTGPGTGSSSDPSWLTPWVEIDPPEVPGERRVVNIRYTCYTGTKYGSKPQVMGEALELPPP